MEQFRFGQGLAATRPARTGGGRERRNACSFLHQNLLRLPSDTLTQDARQRRPSQSEANRKHSLAPRTSRLSAHPPLPPLLWTESQHEAYCFQDPLPPVRPAPPAPNRPTHAAGRHIRARHRPPRPRPEAGTGNRTLTGILQLVYTHRFGKSITNAIPLQNLARGYSHVTQIPFASAVSGYSVGSNPFTLPASGAPVQMFSP
jgi:hypothetical protein